MKVNIYNKMESMQIIKELNLNVFPERYFSEYNENNIKDFLNQYPSPYYAIRDKSKSASKNHQLAVPFEDVCEQCKGLSKFTLNVSSYCYKENQLCVGEIRVDNKMNIEYILSNNPSFSLRDCYRQPDYKGYTNIYDKKMKNIKGYDTIIDYILNHDLIDLIVEFAVFDCKVGINDDYVIIYELRTDY